VTRLRRPKIRFVRDQLVDNQYSARGARGGDQRLSAVRGVQNRQERNSEAVSHGIGGFRGSHQSHGSNFPNWSTAAGARVVVGDFDGDLDADLAVTGVQGWGSIPTAFSDRTGGFNVSNTNVLGFPGLATAEAKYTSGDFDGNGKTDIAVSSRLGESNNIYFAMSRGDDGYNFWVLPIPFIPDLSNRTTFVIGGQSPSVTSRTNLMLLGGGVPYVMSVRL
jgi:hypothetical protein